jgi:hypothetical protein
MHPEDDNRLEAEIDCEMKRLRDLAAPPGLVSRVMLAIDRPKRAAWYLQPWPEWHPALRATALAVLVAVFGGASLLIWQLSHAAQWSPAEQHLVAWLSPMEGLWRAVRVLAVTLFSTAKNLPAGVLLVWAVAAGAAYAFCAGLSTAVFKFAFARR